jgi:DUF971 family protein
VESGVNLLIVSFTGSQNAYPDPFYYYSVDGTEFANSGFNSANANIVIPGLTTKGNYSVQLMAVNPAGNLVSGNVVGNPYVLGTANPNITLVQSNANSLIVSFTGSQNAYPEPYYYYSVDGSAFVPSGFNSANANIVIPNLATNGNYSVQLMAVNPAGNLLSGNAFGKPYVLGNTNPNITKVESGVNSLIVSFTGSQNAYPDPFYYYSVNGNAFVNSGINDANATITIPNLTINGNYSVQLLAVNPAGNLISGNSFGNPYVIGNVAPNITLVQNNVNSLIVSFTGSVGAYPDPYYYYSVKLALFDFKADKFVFASSVLKNC